jgi:hypothetical protein
MKKKLAIIAVFVFYGLITNAQFVNKSKPVSPENIAKQLPAQIFTQLLNSIKSTSFISSFAKQKQSLLNNVEKAKDPAAVAKNISTLVSFIKPEMFNKNFNSAALIKPATAPKTMPAAVALLKDLETGLKPEAISDFWKLQKTGWLADINKVK